MTRRLLGALAAVSLGSVAAAQIRLPDLPARIPSLSSLLQGQPLTTSLDDAAGPLPMLDDYDPVRVAPMMALPGRGDGTYGLAPGFYALTVESYCLQPGAFRPGRGDGYEIAPLKGGGADGVQAILRGTIAHPEIPQGDVQLLLWGVIARTPIDAMDPALQTAARALMTPAQIARVNGGALSKIPDDVRDELLARADPVTQRVFDAEAQIRDLLAQPGATLDDLEDIAMPERDATAERGPEVPASRWSFDARGYFVRYKADVYSEMTTEAYVPEAFTVTRDAVGRVTRVADAKGRRISVEYGSGNAVASARIERQSRPSHRARLRTEAAMLAGGAPSGDAAWPSQLDDFARRWTRDSNAPLARGYEGALDLLRLRRGLKAAAQRSGVVPRWAADEIDMLASAFQYTLCRAAGRCGAAPARAELRVPRLALVSYVPREARPRVYQGAAPGDGGGMDPAGGAGVPGGSGKQRLGPSRKPKKCPTPDDVSKLEDRLKFVDRALELTQQYIDDPSTEFDDGGDFYDRFQHDLEQDFGPIVDQGSYDSSTGTQQNNVGACASDDVACQVTAVETDDHEDQHRRNDEACKGGANAGVCGDNPPGRDYARDEKSAYEQSAKRLRDAIANAKSCKG